MCRKNFLLLAGYYYYPQSGTDDWVGTYQTREEAEQLVSKEVEHDYFSRGPRKGQVKETRERYKVNGRVVDWYEIVDLDGWTK